MLLRGMISPYGTLETRADGDFVHQCPTDAIHITVIDGSTRRPSVQFEVVDDADGDPEE